MCKLYDLKTYGVPWTLFCHLCYSGDSVFHRSDRTSGLAPLHTQHRLGVPLLVPQWRGHTGQKAVPVGFNPMKMCALLVVGSVSHLNILFPFLYRTVECR